MAKQTSKRQAQPEMIRCENCGELYSATYRCCPFCDERPGRRVDDYKHRNPIQIAVLIITMVVILAAAFIVFSKVAPLLSSKAPSEPEVVQPTNDPDKPLTGSDLVPGSTGEQTPTEPTEPTPTEPVEDNTVPAVAIVLSREDITLLPNESYTLTATVAPANTTNLLIWHSNNPDVLSIDQTGTVTNKNTTGEKVAVTVTAIAGKVKAECIVRCNSAGGNAPAPTEPTQPSSGTETPTTPSTPTITKKTDAKVVGAGSGLNVRSGPGSSYEKVASIQNGNSVVILEDTGTGWYKIDYGAGKTGYASSQFIQPK